MLARLATRATHHPAWLETLVALLSEIGDRFSSVAGLGAQVLLPVLVGQVVASLRALLPLDDSPSQGGPASTWASPEQTTATVSTLLSLCHLVIDRTSPADFVDRDGTGSGGAAGGGDVAAEEDLIRLVDTHGVDVQLAEIPLPYTLGEDLDGAGGGISVESGVVGLLERLWEVRARAGAGPDEAAGAGAQPSKVAGAVAGGAVV